MVHEMDLLRFTTAGSVDDGKSTLIGRLLHDSKTVFEDQLAAVEARRLAYEARPAATRTWRSSPMVCTPSASRALRSTSPTATSRRRGEVHHRRLPRAPAVHAQHGHRGVDGGSRRHSGRRAARHPRTDPAARVPRFVARHSTPGPGREQDGPRRLRRRCSRRIKSEFRRLCRQARHGATWHSSRPRP